MKLKILLKCVLLYLTLMSGGWEIEWLTVSLNIASLYLVRIFGWRVFLMRLLIL